MGTPFEEIEDLGMISVQDYRIDNLANANQSVLQTFLDGLLIRAVPKFTTCLKPLDYDLNTRIFESTFNNIEKEILAILFNIEWMTWVVQDVTQFQNKMQNREFKTFAEAENLKQKKDYLNEMREKVNQLIVDYQLQNLSSLMKM